MNSFSFPPGGAAGGTPNPFAGAAPAAANPFAPAAAPATANPFAPAGAPAPSNTFAPAAGASPFGAFAPAATPAKAAATPFGFPTPAAGTNPFAPAAAAAPAAAQTGLGIGGFGSPPRAPAAGAAPFSFSSTAPVGGSAFGFTQPAAPVAPARPLSVAGQYLLQWDNVYNAHHPDCKFRAFLYNMCTPGQSEQAVAAERRANPGIKEEQWINAKRLNPDPERMYPYPVHFMAGLRNRAQKQQDTLQLYHKHANSVASKAKELKQLQDRNEAAYKKLVLDQIMMERKLLAVTAKVEVMRQLGLKLGPEKHSVLERTNALLNVMNSPGRFKALYAELQAAADSKQRLVRGTSRAVGSAADGGVLGGVAGGMTQRFVTTHGTVDANTLREWIKFLDRMSSGLAALNQSISRDTEDLVAAMDRSREIQSGLARV